MSDNFISLQEAKELTKRYRDNFDSIATPDFTNSLSYSETFDAAAVKALIDQPGCVGFRVYYGMKEDKKICAIFVGVNTQDEDMLNGAESIIVEKGKICPPYCTDNPL